MKWQHKNDELEKENAEIRRKIETFQSSSGSRSNRNNVVAPNVISLSAGLSEEEVKARKPRDPPLRPEDARLFKECILSSSGQIYSDKLLQIAVVRTIDSTTKSATIKLNFFNKSPDLALTVTRFDVSSYNKAGTSLSYNAKIAFNITSKLSFPLKIPPGEQAGGDIKVTLKRYLVEDTLFHLAYQFAAANSQCGRVPGEKALTSARVKLPVDVLIFCSECTITEDGLSKKLSELPPSCKKEGKLSLDTTRIPDETTLRELLSTCGLVRVFKGGEPGKVWLGTHFEHKTAKSEAYAGIDLRAGKIVVVGNKPTFTDAILKDLLDVISK